MKRFAFCIFIVAISAALGQKAMNAPGLAAANGGTATCLQANAAGTVSPTGPMCGLAPGTILGQWQEASGSQPLGVVSDSAGNIYVANHSLWSVTKWSSSGTKLWTTSVQSGTEDLTVDQSDNVWTEGYNQPTAGTAITVTFTNGSAVISGANTLVAGQIGQLTTTGALPTNFSASTWLIVNATGLSSGTFELSTSTAGTPIVAGSAGSGTQTFVPYTFYITELSPSGAVLNNFPIVSPNPLTSPNSNQSGACGGAFDLNGNFWFTVSQNTGGVLEEMSSAGTILNTYTSSLFACSNPTIDRQGNIWVPGFGASQTITQFSPSGIVLQSFSTGAGTNPGDITFDKDWNLWVTYTLSHQVAKWTPSGALLFTLSVDSSSSAPAPTAVAIDGAGNAWIPSHGSGYVWEYSSGGQLLSPSGGWPDGGLANSIAIDPAGNVWVDGATTLNITKLQGSSPGWRGSIVKQMLEANYLLYLRGLPGCGISGNVLYISGGVCSGLDVTNASGVLPNYSLPAQITIVTPANPTSNPTAATVTSGGTTGVSSYNYARCVYVDTYSNVIALSPISSAVTTTSANQTIPWTCPSITYNSGGYSFQIWACQGSSCVPSHYFTSSSSSYTQNTAATTGASGALPTTQSFAIPPAASSFNNVYLILSSPATVTPLLPSSAGVQLCVRNAPGQANVITMAALGASSYYELTTHAGWGTANHTLISGGAATDFICFVGIDAYHYAVMASTGTWTD